MSYVLFRLWRTRSHEIARRGITSLHQIVLHRRDMDLWKTDIRSAAAGRLRHTPFLGRTSLYPTELIKNISDELREDDRHSAIAMAVRKVHPSIHPTSG